MTIVQRPGQTEASGQWSDWPAEQRQVTRGGEMKAVLESGDTLQRALLSPCEGVGQTAAWSPRAGPFPRPRRCRDGPCCCFHLGKSDTERLSGRPHLCASVQKELSLTPSTIYECLYLLRCSGPVCPPRPHSSLWGRAQALFCR